MITAAEKRADTPSVGTRRPQRLGCSFIYSYAAWVTVNDLMSSLCVYFHFRWTDDRGIGKLEGEHVMC